jgi:hypothetical protein
MQRDVEAAVTQMLSAVCQQTARNPRTADGLQRMKCLVRHGIDGFHHPLKVETRVRTPLGVQIRVQVRADISRRGGIWPEPIS